MWNPVFWEMQNGGCDFLAFPGAAGLVLVAVIEQLSPAEAFNRSSAGGRTVFP